MRDLESSKYSLIKRHGDAGLVVCEKVHTQKNRSYLKYSINYISSQSLKEEKDMRKKKKLKEMK